MTNEVSKPLSYHVPVEKICEKLKKKDGQICELKYGKREDIILLLLLLLQRIFIYFPEVFSNSCVCVFCCGPHVDKQLDLTTVDLKKLKVKDLKKILEEWGESCKGCAEKSDFIRKITELMPKYAPAAAKARTDL